MILILRKGHYTVVEFVEFVGFVAFVVFVVFVVLLPVVALFLPGLL